MSRSGTIAASPSTRSDATAKRSASSIGCSRNPDNGAALAQRGIALAEVGRYPEAEVALARAVSLRPDDAPRSTAAASRCRGSIAPPRRSICHDRALAINPANPAALNNRGHALLALGRYAEALDSYDRALAFAPAGARVAPQSRHRVQCNAVSTTTRSTCLDDAILLAPNDAGRIASAATR